MDALQAVEKEEKRLRSKIDTCQKNLNKYLDGLIEQVQTLQNDISEGIYVYLNYYFYLVFNILLKKKRS